jgi:hypothetical protein
MFGDGHSGSRRTLEFPAIVQLVVRLPFGIFHYFAGVWFQMLQSDQQKNREAFLFFRT